VARPRVLLVHGSVVNGEATWAAQRPLAERFELVVPNRRGFPPGPDVASVDYEDEAEWLVQFLRPGGADMSESQSSMSTPPGESDLGSSAAGAHLVGHSYGGVIALFAAARFQELVRSLTVIEPPCLRVAAGDPIVDDFIESSDALWEAGPHDPETFLRSFLNAVGSSEPREVSPALLQGARTLMVERYPWRAEIPLEELKRTTFPKLVVSGAHSHAFDAVCDVLERELGAERAALPGAGHAVQFVGEPFNALLAEFVERAEV